MRSVVERVVRPAARVWLRPTVRGAAGVPADGPVILASNHLSFIDSTVIPMALPRPVWFLAKKEYFEGRGVSGWAVRKFFEGMGHVPVERGGGRAALEAMRTAQAVLDRGGALGIYPEGTRSRDGRMHRGRTGVARLAVQSGAPVVPVAVVGTQRVQPVGARVPRPYPVAVHFGRPLRFGGGARSAAALRAITDEVVQEILALSGQEYVDEYHPES